MKNSSSLLLSLSNLLLLQIISSIQDNASIICLLLTCKKLYINSTRRLVQFKGLRLIDSKGPFIKKGYISEKFIATATQFKLFSFNDILENSISDQQVILPLDEKTKDFKDWIKQRINVNDRVADKDKSNITTALVMYSKASMGTILESLYSIPSIETLLIKDHEDSTDGIGSFVDLDCISLLPNLQRLSVRIDVLNLGHHSTLKSLELDIGSIFSLANLNLLKFTSLTRLKFHNHVMTNIVPGLFPTSLTSLTLRPTEIPPQDTFISLTSLVALKIYLDKERTFVNVPITSEQGQSRPFINLDSLSNLKTLKFIDNNDPSKEDDNNGYCIEMSVPPSLRILYIQSSNLQIPSRCVMPMLEKLDVTAHLLIDERINLVSQCPSIKRLDILDCLGIIPATVKIPDTVVKLLIDKKTKQRDVLTQVVMPPSLTHLSIFGGYEHVQLPDSISTLGYDLNIQTVIPQQLKHLKKLNWGVDTTCDFVFPSSYPPNLETINLYFEKVGLLIETIPPLTKYLSIAMGPEPKRFSNNIPIYSIGSRISDTFISQSHGQWLPLNTTHLNCRLGRGSDSNVAFRLDQVINHTNVRSLFISCSRSCIFYISIQRLDTENRNVLIVETKSLQGGIISQQRKSINNNNQQQQEYDPIYLYLDTSTSPFKFKWRFG
ncbi:hypothetical protein DFA_08341 [Cavenderia fasciculata]|uniref:Uncharacterized protein n=1 Tax=Cavenderia fasciculata TaxID=261658 RepID=F4Q5T7_CACFS|nr:uncharacterized protein DFA_08341 [Cavenderia fasciculata]EGG17346.1 hypothetical protein DFA_08341 [Cavenderia fasciculata]|eukprot:XP_004355830.1 hypothetical protein DFA_08341 [Cavenderia fasciculata]